jgi:hypothetical protein
VFSNLLPPDGMAVHREARAPTGELEKSRHDDGLLYRRGNFNGTGTS